MSERPQLVLLLCGGLGNQLFQYAYARSLAKQMGADLILDPVTGFVRDVKYRRAFELDVFSIPSSINVIAPSLAQIKLRELRLKLAYRSKSLNWGIILEKWQGEELPDLQCATTFLHGYWQHPKHLDSIKSVLTADLRFSRRLDERNVDLANRMSRGNSVAIHARRSQYKNALDESYYIKAIKMISRRVENAEFFCFSDDTKWCDEYLRPYCDFELVSRPKQSGVEDFRLMSMCNNFIIANSTYSWWSAWIGARDVGLVVAPSSRHWDANARNIIPQNWQVV